MPCHTAKTVIKNEPFSPRRGVELCSQFFDNLYCPFSQVRQRHVCSANHAQFTTDQNQTNFCTCYIILKHNIYVPRVFLCCKNERSTNIKQLLSLTGCVLCHCRCKLFCFIVTLHKCTKH